MSPCIKSKLLFWGFPGGLDYGVGWPGTTSVPYRPLILSHKNQRNYSRNRWIADKQTKLGFILIPNCEMNRWLDFLKAFSAVLFNDRLLVAVLCGGVTGVFVFVSLRPVSLLHLSEWDNNFQETCDELWCQWYLHKQIRCALLGKPKALQPLIFFKKV